MRYLPHLDISYCTNVHAGEGLEALLRHINHDIPKVKRLVAPQAPFGSGLRMGYETVKELSQDPRALIQLKQALDEQDIYVFSVNGFPYGDFAAPQVKAKVYEPDWSTKERVDYTLNLARVMTALPGPQLRSISTVAGGFVPSLDGLKTKDQAFTQQFAHLAQGLFELEDETGVAVRIALEPEPWTRLERVDQVLPFFEDVVWSASPLTQKYIGLCYDTCHQALAFEDPKDSWDSLLRSNIPVYKVQVSNALRLPNPQDTQARQRLLSFAEKRYLHQVSALTTDGSILRALDLPEVSAASEAWLNAVEWRCHFHVPIWWRGDESFSPVDQTTQTKSKRSSIAKQAEQVVGNSVDQQVLGLGTTYQHWEQIAHCLKDPCAQAHTQNGDRLHVEVETYSWHVLPESLKSEQGLHYEIAQELGALQKVLSSVESD